MDTPYVLAIGEALIDAISTTFVNDLSEATATSLKPGGSPANYCRFLHALGTPAKLVAAIGADGLGRIILQDLQQKQIDSSQIALLEDQPTTLIVVGKSKGTPDFIPYRGADQFIQPVAASLVQDCAIVHSTAFALSREPARSSILAAMTLGKQLGKAVSVDWNYAEKIWGAGNEARAVFQTLTALDPLLKFSLDDAERFFGAPMDAATAKAFLQAFPTRVCCLTCGAAGVWYREGKGDWQHAEAAPVEVKDSTGAGDSFWAGFTDAYLNHQRLEICIEHALATAALRLEGKLH